MFIQFNNTTLNRVKISSIWSYSVSHDVLTLFCDKSAMELQYHSFDEMASDLEKLDRQLFDIPEQLPTLSDPDGFGEIVANNRFRFFNSAEKEKLQFYTGSVWVASSPELEFRFKSFLEERGHLYVRS